MFIKIILFFLFTFKFSLIVLAQTGSKSADATVSFPASADYKAASRNSSDRTSPSLTNSNPPLRPALAKPTSSNSVAISTSLDATSVRPIFEPDLATRTRPTLEYRLAKLDFRQLKFIEWPALDLLKDKESEYKKLEAIQDVKLLRKQLHQRCISYVNEYIKHIKTQMPDINVGKQYHLQCDIYALLLEDSQDPLAERFYDIPGLWFYKRLDAATLVLYQNSTGENIKRNIPVNVNPRPNLNPSLNPSFKAYQTSPFGLLGIPWNLSIWVTQGLLIINLAASIFLIYSKFR